MVIQIGSALLHLPQLFYILTSAPVRQLAALTVKEMDALVAVTPVKLALLKEAVFATVTVSTLYYIVKLHSEPCTGVLYFECNICSYTSWR